MRSAKPLLKIQRIFRESPQSRCRFLAALQQNIPFLASCQNILANLLSVNLINSFHLKLIELSNLFCTFRVRIINVIIINLQSKLHSNDKFQLQFGLYCTCTLFSEAAAQCVEIFLERVFIFISVNALALVQRVHEPCQAYAPVFFLQIVHDKFLLTQSPLFFGTDKKKVLLERFNLLQLMLYVLDIRKQQ